MAPRVSRKTAKAGKETARSPTIQTQDAPPSSEAEPNQDESSRVTEEMPPLSPSGRSPSTGSEDGSHIPTPTTPRFPSVGHDSPDQNPSEPPPTFRECLMKPFGGFRLKRQIDWALKGIAGSGKEPPSKHAVALLAYLMCDPNPDYDPYPSSDVNPTLECRFEIDLSRLYIEGGKAWRDTTFHQTLMEIYRQRQDLFDEKDPQHRISRPDATCVAYCVDPGLYGESGGTSATEESTKSSIETEAGDGGSAAASATTQTTSAKGAGSSKKDGTNASSVGSQSSSSTTSSNTKHLIKKSTKLEIGVDNALCMASLVIEFKIAYLFRQFCQLCAYLVQTFEISGTRLGLYVHRSQFLRLFLVQDNVVLMETKDHSRWNKVLTLMDLNVHLSRSHHWCPHNLRRKFEKKVNPEAAGVLTEFLDVAIECLINFPFKGPNLSMMSPAQLPIIQRILPKAKKEFSGSVVRDDNEDGLRERYTVVWGARQHQHSELTEICANRFPELVDGMNKRTPNTQTTPATTTTTQPENDDDPGASDEGAGGPGGSSGDVPKDQNPPQGGQGSDPGSGGAKASREGGGQEEAHDDAEIPEDPEDDDGASDCSADSEESSRPPVAMTLPEYLALDKMGLRILCCSPEEMTKTISSYSLAMKQRSGGTTDQPKSSNVQTSVRQRPDSTVIVTDEDEAEYHTAQVPDKLPTMPFPHPVSQSPGL